MESVGNTVSPQMFKELYGTDRQGELKPEACSRLMSRLHVGPAEQYETLNENTTLNSRQFVFVTPAASWLSQDRNKAAAALDHVGWDPEDIVEASEKKKEARLWVWEAGADVTAASATWDRVFACLKEAAQSGTKLTQDHKQRPVWSSDDAKNQQFVAWVCERRSEIEALQGWKQNSQMGVEAFWENPSVLHARQAINQLLWVGPLFKGDGYTYNKNGEKKAPEFLVRTQTFAQLSGLCYVHFGVVKAEP